MHPIEAIAPTTLYAARRADPARPRGAARAAGDRATPHICRRTRRQYQDRGMTPAGWRAARGWRSGEDEEQVAEHLRALGYLE